MSKIFVIQPDRMMRQAFVMALLPDFEVVFAESLPQKMPSGIDAVIVDAVSAKPDERQAVLARWPVPLIWIDGKTSVEPPRRDRCEGIQWPVTKDELRRALAQSLTRDAALKNHSGPQVSESKSDLHLRRRIQNSKSDILDVSGKFIELTDVVEEETA